MKPLVPPRRRGATGSRGGIRRGRRRGRGVTGALQGRRSVTCAQSGLRRCLQAAPQLADQGLPDRHPPHHHAAHDRRGDEAGENGLRSCREESPPRTRGPAIQGPAIRSRPNCRACHDPWHGISQSRCTECHGKVPHAEQEASEPPCADCPSRAPRRWRSSPPAPTPPASHATATSRITSRTPAFSRRKRHEILQHHVLRQQSPRLHAARRPRHAPLQPPPSTSRPGGVPNAEGRREELKCEQCHKLVETKAKAVTVDPVALRFQDHCQRCHKLTFDSKLSERRGPAWRRSRAGVRIHHPHLHRQPRQIAGKSPEVATPHPRRPVQKSHPGRTCGALLRNRWSRTRCKPLSRPPAPGLAAGGHAA